MEVWKIIFLSKWVICMFHVNLPGCMDGNRDVWTQNFHGKMIYWFIISCHLSFLVGFTRMVSPRILKFAPSPYAPNGTTELFTYIKNINLSQMWVYMGVSKNNGTPKSSI